MSAESINEEFVLEGEPPSPFNIPSGCRFNPRCPYASDACRTTDPALATVAPQHESACIRASELDVLALTLTKRTSGKPAA
jgi:oligopeptide/dipeptide ABC transporter ATP-binding protein